MGACLAVALGFIVESVISVVCKYHADRAINDTIIWICSNIIKELFGGCGSVFSG